MGGDGWQFYSSRKKQRGQGWKWKCVACSRSFAHNTCARHGSACPSCKANMGKQREVSQWCEKRGWDSHFVGTGSPGQLVAADAPPPSAKGKGVGGLRCHACHRLGHMPLQLFVRRRRRRRRLTTRWVSVLRDIGTQVATLAVNVP